MLSNPALALRSLHFRYQRAPVLAGFSLTLAPGELVALVGPNGSGKTTVLRLVTGAIRPQDGVILIGGQPRSAYRRRALARWIALVPQELQVTFDFTAEELVLMGRGPHVHWLRGETAADRHAAREAMERVDVADISGRPFRELSGGEKQRVVLAMALAQRPRILLLDEPTANLDIAHQAGLFDLVRQLNRDIGLTVLTAIHDLNLASLYCDRLVLLQNGRVAVEGQPDTVITPTNLERCYGVPMHVYPHPSTGRPQVALIPSEDRRAPQATKHDASRPASG